MCAMARYRYFSSAEKVLILLAPVYRNTIVLHSSRQCRGEECAGRVGWQQETRPLYQAIKARFMILRYKHGIHIPSLQDKTRLPS